MASQEEQPQQFELYRITRDPEERANLAAQEPGRAGPGAGAGALQRKLDAW